MDQGWAAVLAATLAAAVTGIGFIASQSGLSRIEKLTNIIERMTDGVSRRKLEAVRDQLIDRYTLNRNLRLRFVRAGLWSSGSGTVLATVAVVLGALPGADSTLVAVRGLCTLAAGILIAIALVCLAVLGVLTIRDDMHLRQQRKAKRLARD